MYDGEVKMVGWVNLVKETFGGEVECELSTYTNEISLNFQ